MWVASHRLPILSSPLTKCWLDQITSQRNPTFPEAYLLLRTTEPFLDVFGKDARLYFSHGCLQCKEKGVSAPPEQRKAEGEEPHLKTQYTLIISAIIIIRDVLILNINYKVEFSLGILQSTVACHFLLVIPSILLIVLWCKWLCYVLIQICL